MKYFIEIEYDRPPEGVDPDNYAWRIETKAADLHEAINIIVTACCNGDVLHWRLQQEIRPQMWATVATMD